MTTFNELKRKYFEHLASVDLAALSVAELEIYGRIMNTVNEMLKPSYTEQMASMMMGCACKREEDSNDG